MNRFTIVVEQDTERCFTVPKKGEQELADKLDQTLLYMQGVSGALTLSPAAFTFFDEVYRKRKQYLREIENPIMIEVIERWHVHTLRYAMLLHLSNCSGMEICDKCIQTAYKLVKFVEDGIPPLIQNLSNVRSAQDTALVLSALKRLGGAADHSNLLRRSRLDASTFKRVITTLEEQGLLKAHKKGALRFYALVEEES